MKKKSMETSKRDITTIELPKDLHKQFKLFSVEAGVPMKELTVKAIEDIMNAKKSIASLSDKYKAI